MDNRPSRRLVKRSMPQRHGLKRSRSGTDATAKTVARNVNSRLALIVDADRELATLVKRTLESDTRLFRIAMPHLGPVLLSDARS